MRTLRVAAVAAFTLCAGCPGPKGFELTPTPLPAPDAVKTTLKVTDVLYIDDVTFATDPSLLLGKIFRITTVGGQCPSDLAGADVRFFDRIGGYPVTPRTAPTLRGSHIVSHSVAASVTLLSYLTGSLNDSTLSSVIVTDEDIQRVNDGDGTYGAARRAWVQAHGDLMANQNVCWLVIVDGVVHKTIVSRLFHRFSGNATAGGFGVNVGGRYFASDESYQLEHRFGLSVSVLKAPSSFRTLAGDIAPTPDERDALGRITVIREAPSTNP